MSRYLIDTNVFISAAKSTYGMDFCPAFWEWILRAHAAGIVHSVDRVRDELLGTEDELADWVHALPTTFFIQETPDDLHTFAAVVEWARSEAYLAHALQQFVEGADAMLIAQARTRGAEVVTLEVPSTSQKRAVIKIPNACVGVNVRYLTTWTMLRREQVRFVLQP